jgi:hypothetical protein
MLQRLQQPLLHHCEASAIMRQLSQWLNAFWAHASDPAGTHVTRDAPLHVTADAWHVTRA